MSPTRVRALARARHSQKETKKRTNERESAASCCVSSELRGLFFFPSPEKKKKKKKLSHPFFSPEGGKVKKKVSLFLSSSTPHLPRARGLDGPPALAGSAGLGSGRRGGGRGVGPLAPAAGGARGAIGEERILEGRGEARRDDGDVELALVRVVDDLLFVVGFSFPVGAGMRETTVREKNTPREERAFPAQPQFDPPEKKKRKKKLTAPKMTLAAGSASEDTTCDTSLTSASVMSLPPVMLYTTPVARSIERSISGAEVAASAASRARPLPEATPTPSMAVPESRMMALTSAKSTLTCFVC